MLELDAQATSSATPEQVWALLADVRTWPRWADFDEAEVESGSGLGETRSFRRGRYRTRERVTVFERPHRFGYDFLSGLPIRDYHADVTLTERDGGTDIRWHSTFRARVPGTGRLIRRSLQGFVADTSERLARAAGETSSAE
jgi:uncharacterized protein YndB with AHSA1/START domain